MSGQKKTSVLTVQLLDDHNDLRRIYREILEKDPQLELLKPPIDSAESAGKSEARAQVTILDVSLPVDDSTRLIRQSILRRPNARVLVFSVHTDPASARRALQAGARGYLTKANPPEVLREAVKAVAAGRRFLSADIECALQRQAGKTCDMAATLTQREYRMLSLLAEGLTLQQIASCLGLSRKTIANRQTAIRIKLGASSAIQLLLIAQRMGLGTPGSDARES